LLRQYLTKPTEPSTGGLYTEGREMAYVGGQVVFVNCIPADSEVFPACYSYLSSITTALGEAWTAKVVPKARPVRQCNHNYVESKLRSIIQGVALNTYSSMRSFGQEKLSIVAEAKRCKAIIR
jgi:hypothetical protein